jgi:hypothetical protein
MASVVTLIIEPNCLNVIASDSANRPAENRQNHEKIFKKKCISDLLTLIFSRYETGTTGIFLRLMQLTYFRYVGYTVTDASQTHNIHRYITIAQHEQSITINSIKVFILI